MYSLLSWLYVASWVTVVVCAFGLIGLIEWSRWK